jgi:predicted MFS family arabinose efflux permease
MIDRKKSKATDEIFFLLSVPVGIYVGVFLMNLIQSFSPYQAPQGVDYTSGKPMIVWMEKMPDKGHAYALLSFVVGCFVAGFVSNYMARNSKYRPALITGFCLLFYAVVSYLAFPNPMWMSVMSCAGCAIFAGIGGMVVKKQQKE